MPQTPKRSDLEQMIGKLRAMRQELRGDDPIAIGALGGAFHVGEASFELPRGTVHGSPDAIAENLNELVEIGVSHIHVRFPSRSVDELCEQISSFSEQVMPLF